jgi:hypothetical protein
MPENLKLFHASLDGENLLRLKMPDAIEILQLFFLGRTCACSKYGNNFSGSKS